MPAYQQRSSSASHISIFCTKQNYCILRLLILVLILTLPLSAFGADVVTNGDFVSDITTGWTNSSSGTGSSSWDGDGTIHGAAQGTALGATELGRNKIFSIILSQSLGTVNSTDDVYLSLWWYKASIAVAGSQCDARVLLVRPGLDTVEVWSETQVAGGGSSLTGNVSALDISASFNANGSYTLILQGDVGTINDKNAQTLIYFDDLVVDVQSLAGNNAPTVILGASQVSQASVNRHGANLTTISTTFYDADVPGVNAFTVTFIVKDATETEYTLVDALTNGNGGLTISDDGGGYYTASYSWDPGEAQVTGDYDLYFYVTDGTDNATDPYTSNADELNLFQQVAPTLTADATLAVPATVNRVGSNTTTISTDFTDIDEPAISSFIVTFKVKDISEVEYTLVNALTNGNGGLTVIDNGAGSYTASYSWDPDLAQAVGDYDLYFYVSDGTDNVTDDYVINANELLVQDIAGNNAPTVVADATQAAPATVNRVGTNTTTISTDFNDTDQPVVGSFIVTFKVKDISEVEYTLVNALTNGNGGLTVIDNGGGSYTASYSWDPIGTQAVGDYDLYFYVSDGTDNVTDDYVINANELLVENIIANNAPTVTADATQVSPATVDRVGANTTTISTVFNDSDQPGIAAFTVTFKVKDATEAEYTLVNALTNGNGGLTITDGGGGSYTASYSWDPGVGQTLGDYDLYFYVSDGTDNVTDDYTPNANELNVFQSGANTAPTVTADATIVTLSPINRIGAATTTIRTDFYDADQPAVSSFFVTFKIREPDNLTELTLVNNLTDGNGGLTVTSLGGGDYRASYSYNPDDAQTQGLYDLYFYVSDGTDNVTDDYTANLDELEINEAAGGGGDVIVNGAFPTDITTGWTDLSVGSDGTTSWDGSIGSGSLRAHVPGRNKSHLTVLSQAVGPINATDDVTLSLYWQKSALNLAASAATMTVRIIKPSGTDSVDIWTETQTPVAGETLSNTVTDLIVSAFFDQTGTYTIRLIGDVQNGNDNGAETQCNFDDVVLDVSGGGAVNNAPTVTSDNTAVSSTPVNRLGTASTTISTTFYDTDDPGVGGFFVTFKVREPDNLTELFLVNDQPNGVGGLTITNNGGGSYTAEYTWDPSDAQTVGWYDLYFSVSDGEAIATDLYTPNEDELYIENSVPNNPPTLTAGATLALPTTVNRAETNTTLFSTNFNDSDQPVIGTFVVTFKVKDESEIEYTLVDGLTNGNGGLIITDNGSGSYTASYTWDPSDAQPTGSYDLYCYISDGTDNVTDPYTSNVNQLTVEYVVANDAPVVITNITRALPATVNRLYAGVTQIYAEFSDTDLPAVGSFTVTFKVREPNNSTELTLVDNLTHGSGGLVITDLGSGSFSATYDWDPGVLQTLGDYDLYFYVHDGIAGASDEFADNLDELNVYELIINNPPTFVAGATSVSPGSIPRLGVNPTTISASFTDTDIPGVADFSISFAVRLTGNLTPIVLANQLANGVSGMSVSDDGGGNYTAGFSWDPPDDLDLGYYDLECTVYDNEASVDDPFTNNVSELLINDGGEPKPPVVSKDATFATPAGVERIGANPTTISATFLDEDSPAVSVFLITFKIREPDNSTEILLADNIAHGVGGLTIVNQGGGIYEAAIDWDPGDLQTLGFYDLYFSVTEGVDVSFDEYSYNENELEVYDAISNNPPTLTSGNTFVLPTMINRIGSEFTMLKAAFNDSDIPGVGAFTVTMKLRDASLTEYTLVNAAKHGEQGLRIVQEGGGDYEVSVLWEPPDAQVTGTYDLYFSVEDNFAASVVDDYAINGDELTVMTATILGDGKLLRRSNVIGNCGGEASACHNIMTHQGQDCETCHSPHGTKNLFMINETIYTPNSGNRTVDFMTVGIGDPYNDPDPVVGSWAGAMADDADGVHSGVCEVCHTLTTRHRNDDLHPDQGHKNATICSSCHSHEEGFPNLEAGGGESAGGNACAGCHGEIFSPLNSSTSSYHHQVNSDAADYTIANKTCLICHVDHDIFRPDMNLGFGTRAKNLRMSVNITPTQGNNTTLLNSDYISSGDGGVCLSCHTSTQAKNFTPPDGSTETFAISKADYDAATSAHNYSVPVVYTADASTFNANCIKCHSDEMAKQYQDAGTQLSTHDVGFRRFLFPFNIALPVDPLEEKFCFGCHSTTSNPYGGANKDGFNSQTISTAAARVEDAMSLTYKHPTALYSQRHTRIENAAELADGNRHAECEDCHDVHGTIAGTHDGSSALVSNALKNVWGVEPTGYPSSFTYTDNANTFYGPTGYTKLEPAVKEYQICLKCHSNYTTLPSGSRDLAEEINPNYPSTHGILTYNQNPYCNSTTMNEPWGTSGTNYCSDCHRSDNAADPEGPHGSNAEHLLRATIVSDGTNGTPLCLECHKASVYWDGSAASSKFDQHPATKGAHQLDQGCLACHMWDYASASGIGVSTTSWAGGNPTFKLFVHGQNKRWVYQDRFGTGTAGTGQDVDAFVNGMMSDMDYTNNLCWSEVCKTHAGTGY